MQIYLPIAEMAVDAEAVFLVSAMVGFLSGTLGVGGGFLTTPFLIFIGLPPIVAVGTQTTQLVASGLAGVLGHWKRGNVDFKIGLIMLLGGALGNVAGMFIFKLLEAIGQIDFAISLLYILLLGGVGFFMLFEVIGSMFESKNNVKKEFNSFRVNPFAASLPYKMRFPRSRLYVSALVPGGIGFLGGLLAVILGIGGGFLLVPAMIYILGMPTILAVGTSLFQMIFTTSTAAIMHASVNQTVDVMLALILIVGGVLGAQIGVSIAPYVKALAARIVLSLIVLAVCFRLCSQLFIRPEELFSTVVL